MDITGIKKVLDAMINLLKGYYGGSSSTVIAVLEQYGANAEKRLSDLAKAALSGQASWAFVAARLKDEASNIKNELLSVEQIVATDAQELINDAVAIFETALKNSLPDGSMTTTVA